MKPFKIIDSLPCQCYEPSFSSNCFTIREIGIDKTKSRYGEVSIQECKSCGCSWINYLYEQEAFSQSGRWYRGILPKEKFETITPESTVEYLENLDWYFYGGSFFKGQIRVGKGRLHL